jgi:hypothetical protein
MTGKQALLELLQREAGEATDDALEHLRLAWIHDLDELMAQLRTWLEQPAFDRLLKIVIGTEELNEEDLTYSVPVLTIVFQTRGRPEVKVVPRGMQVVGGIFKGADGKEGRLVGASGRVDLLRGPTRATLLRFVGHDGTTWRWLSRDGELDETSFFDVLRQLIA